MLHRIVILLGFVVLSFESPAQDTSSYVLQTLLSKAYTLRHENKDSAIRMVQEVVNHSVDSFSIQFKAQQTLGLIYELNGQLDSATIAYAQAIHIAQSKQLAPKELGSIYTDWAIVHKKMGKYAIARQYHHKTLDLGIETQDWKMIEMAWNGLATMYSMLSAFDKSIECHLKSKEAAEKYGNQAGVVKSQTNISNIMMKAGNLELAEKNIEVAYQMAQELESEERIAAVLKVWAAIKLELGQYEKALEKNQLALSLYVKMGDKNQLSECYLSTAKIFYQTNHLHKTDSILHLCLEFEPYFSPYTKASIHQLLGEVAMHKGTLGLAQIEIKKSIEQTEIFGFDEIAKENHRLLAVIYAQKGQMKDAYAESLLANQITESLFQKDKQHFLSEAKFKYDEAEKNHQIMLQEQYIESSETTRKWLLAALLLTSFLAVYSWRQTIAKQKALSRIELLLNELHHRVKNNLQTLSSLIRVQSRHIDDPKVKEVLDETRSRLETISMLHQQLYKDEATEKYIDMTILIETLFSKLCFSYGFAPDFIQKKIHIESQYIHVDKAIPIALILNELLTNSFKHAFPSVSIPAISISILGAEINYSDNGCGFHLEQINKDKAFGYKLIKALTKQLKSNFTIRSENGLHFNMKLDLVTMK